MKLILVTLLVILSFSSCKSEYEERLEQARDIISRLDLVEATISSSEQLKLSGEIELLQDEIQFLAKVSGNEKLFLKEVYKD